jgi:hypothetical protein
MMMNHPDHDPDEAGLRALFNSTAEELDGPGHTKLRARAADIPAERRPAWWRLWAPALAVAMGGLLVFGIRSMNQPDSPTPVAQNSATAPLAVQAPPQISAEPRALEEEEEEEEEESEELALGEDDELELDDGADDLLAFGVPSDDAELDAWLEATDELLGEGG